MQVFKTDNVVQKPEKPAPVPIPKVPAAAAPSSASPPATVQTKNAPSASQPPQAAPVPPAPAGPGSKEPEPPQVEGSGAKEEYGYIVTNQRSVLHDEKIRSGSAKTLSFAVVSVFSCLEIIGYLLDMLLIKAVHS